jgi:hypothetical protein
MPRRVHRFSSRNAASATLRNLAETLSAQACSGSLAAIPGAFRIHYSAANRASGLVWDPATLNLYLAAPRQVVPGTLMSYPGLKDDQKRNDLIAYLNSLH